MGTNTRNFRRQHEELLQIASRISSRLIAESLAGNAGEVRDLQSQLAGKLNVHLAMEDEYLYPELLKHEDESIRSLAKRFVDEMGGIKKVFTQYMNKWPSAHTIQEKPSEYIEETRALFKALEKRIRVEDSELYSTVDLIA